MIKTALKLYYFKKMSFLKLRDPKKRELIVNEFLKTKKNIQENFLSESEQRELSKLFKPITESQKETKESLVQELKPIQEGLKELPAIAYPPQLQAIAAPPEGDDEDEESMMQVGRIAHRYLSDYAAKQSSGN